ncbi:arginyltransferase [Aliivibrio kagoshimensis]|uniref:arginyltransferase n=1 Tax=Aliivibrio kagoshimensis TaxID=2910230 RepID=UPI003D128D71
MNDSQTLQVGLTQPHQCNYLAHQQERLAVVMDLPWHSKAGYEILLASGFRRSGETIYTPKCEQCSACQSLRVDCLHFSPSKSQKRVSKQIQHFDFVLKKELDSHWFELYEHYIAARHQSGSMFPANKAQFLTFIDNQWLAPRYLHIYEDDKLIAVAITDVVDNAMSALYTFFDTSHPLSMGTAAILLQIKIAQQLDIKWLYLGFQIDECAAMSYKVRYKPNQKLVNGEWLG